MKNLFLFLLVVMVVGLMSFEENEFSRDDKQISKIELHSNLNSTKYYKIESKYSGNNQLIVFYNQNDIIEYTVRIQGGIAELPNEIKGTTDGNTDNGLVINLSNNKSMIITLNDDNLSTFYDRVVVPSIGYGYAPLKTYNININDLPGSIKEIDNYITNVISNVIGTNPSDSTSSGMIICVSGGEGAKACTSGLTNCKVECTKEYWACCNVRCKCINKAKFDD